MNTTTQIQQTGSESSNAMGGGEGTDLETRRSRFADKQEAKRARFEARAARLLAYADAMYKTSRRITENIPLGQPILVGHHSERGHRADLERSRSAMDRSCKAAKLAEYCQRKAQNVGSGGISSDDPDAIEQLLAKARKLQDWQDRAKKVNALVRRGDRAGLAALGLSEAAITDTFTPDFAGRIGVPAYELQNNLANIKRIELRIRELERVASRADVEQDGAGYVYFEDVADNRLGFRFEGKPDSDTRDMLKRHGFKWSPSRTAWVRQLNNAGLHGAREVRAKLDAQAGETS